MNFVTITPTTGEGTVQVKASVGENTGDPRSQILQIVGRGITKSITVSQEKKYVYSDIIPIVTIDNLRFTTMSFQSSYESGSYAGYMDNNSGTTDAKHTPCTFSSKSGEMKIGRVENFIYPPATWKIIFGSSSSSSDRAIMQGIFMCGQNIFYDVKALDIYASDVPSGYTEKYDLGESLKAMVIKMQSNLPGSFPINLTFYITSESAQNWIKGLFTSISHPGITIRVTY